MSLTPKNLAATFSLMFLSISAAAAEDPLCKNHEGLRRFNPLAENALIHIRSCIAVYCDPKLQDPNAKQEYKHIDSLLSKIQVANAEFGLAVGKYEKACRDLLSHFTQVGDKMDEVRRALFEMEAKAEESAELYQLIQSNEEVKRFSDAGTRASQLKQPACMKEINDSTIGALNQRDDIARRMGKVNCNAPSK